MNQDGSAASLVDVRKYVVDTAGAAPSPIDSFYETSQALVKLGTPQALATEPGFGPLLLVGVVSASENYFRDLFARVIGLCPIARAAAADENVKLGSVVWHRGADAIRAAFEHLSLADADKLISLCKKYLNVQLPKPGIAAEFEKVCQLRHGIVHSGALLGGKNAIALQLPSSPNRLRIAVGFAELQETAAICTSLVVTVNGGAFAELCRRWAVEWPKQPSWNPTEKHPLFCAIWEMFHSKRDQATGVIPSPMSLIKCRNAVVREFT